MSSFGTINYLRARRPSKQQRFNSCRRFTSPPRCPDRSWSLLGLVSVLQVFFYDMICLLTAIELSPGGSTHLHTNNTQNNTNNNRTTQITTNVEECEPCPVFASVTLAFTLQLRKKHGKTSVRVRKTSVRLRNTSVRVQYTYYQNTHTLQNPHKHIHYKTHTYTFPSLMWFSPQLTTHNHLLLLLNICGAIPHSPTQPHSVTVNYLQGQMCVAYSANAAKKKHQQYFFGQNTANTE